LCLDFTSLKRLLWAGTGTGFTEFGAATAAALTAPILALGPRVWPVFILLSALAFTGRAIVLATLLLTLTALVGAVLGSAITAFLSLLAAIRLFRQAKITGLGRKPAGQKHQHA